MAKFNENKIPYEVQDELMEQFCSILTKLKKMEDKKDFLKDLLNRKERMMLLRRLMIAKLLEEGKTYTEISQRLRCGRATIGRVQQWLNFGRDGYKKVLNLQK